MSVTHARFGAGTSNFCCDDSGNECRLAIAPSTTAITSLGLEAFCAHQAIDPMLVTTLAQVGQVGRNLAIAIDPARFQPRLLDERQEQPVLLGPLGFGSGLPSVVAAGMDAHYAAHRANGMLGFGSHNECVLYRNSLAKNAAAFFRMSRSSVTRMSLALRRRNSSCWQVCARRSSGANAYFLVSEVRYRFFLYPYPHSVFAPLRALRIDFSHSSFRDGDCCVDRYHGRCVWQ